jgi:O-antigen/teichoic acid export membrane protein
MHLTLTFKRLWTRVRDVPRLFRRDGFDSTDEADRQARRAASLIATSASLATLRIASFATNIIAIGLLHDHLDPVRFGLWLTLMSLWVLMTQMGDLGAGAGIMNAVARAHGRGDAGHLRRVSASGLLALTLIGMGVATFGAAVSMGVPWQSALRIVQIEVAHDFAAAVLIVAVGVALSITGGLAFAIQRGLQRGYEAYLWQSAGLLVSLVAMYVVVSAAGSTSLSAAAATFFLPIGLIAVLAGVVFFRFQAKSLVPRHGNVDRIVVREVARVSVAVFCLQVVSSLTYFSDPIVLAAVLGPESVAELAIPARLFNMVSLTVSIFILPLWPAYAEAIARGDSGWVRRTLYRSLVISTGVASVGSLTMVALHGPLIYLWIGPEFQADLRAVVGLAIWCVVESFGVAIGILLNAMNRFRVQLAVGAVLLIVSLVARASAAYWLGPYAVPYATFLSYVVCVLIPFAYLVPGILRGLGKSQAPGAVRSL